MVIDNMHTGYDIYDMRDGALESDKRGWLSAPLVKLEQILEAFERSGVGGAEFTRFTRFLGSIPTWSGV